jgi:hypothetical protein
MLARLGNVLFWTGIIIAAAWISFIWSLGGAAVLVNFGIDTPGEQAATYLIPSAIAVGIGWALKYIFTDPAEKKSMGGPALRILRILNFLLTALALTVTAALVIGVLMLIYDLINKGEWSMALFVVALAAFLPMLVMVDKIKYRPGSIGWHIYPHRRGPPTAPK